MKKICFVNTSVPWGGGENWQFETMLHYINSHKVILLTTPKGELYQKAKDAKIETIPVQVGNLSFLNPVKVIKVYRLMKQLSVETIMFNTSKDFKLFTVPAKWAGVKNILYRRDNGKPLKTHLLNKVLLRRGITHFLPCSEYIAKMALAKNSKLFPQNKIEVIYNSINLEEWDSLPIILSSPTNETTIFACVGRLSEEKGQLFLPEIAAKLKSRGEKFKILIAGTGPLQEEFEDQIKKYEVTDCFDLLGFQSKVKQIVDGIHCLIIPSRWEGLPTVAIEAMACNKPVVAFDVAGNPEAVLHESNGFLVPAFNLEKFTDAMQKIIKQPNEAKRMGKKGRQLAEQVFSRKVTNRQLDKFFIM